MKTWEMIKELTENKEKQFKRLQDGLVVSHTCGQFSWSSGHSWLGIHDEWEEVKKPLEFMEVLELVEENKNNTSELKFILEHDFPLKGRSGTLKHIVSEMEYQLSSLGIARILLEGKFYLEED